MFENIMKFFNKFNKKQDNKPTNSREAAKERLHLVLMQDRANVSADFLELMKQEIIEVIKKYIDVDESAIDVRLTNKENEDGTNGAPALYANIPIINIKNEARKMENIKKEENQIQKQQDKIEEKENTKQDNKLEEEKEEPENKKESKKQENSNNKDNTKQEEKQNKNQTEEQEKNKDETSKSNNKQDSKKDTVKTEQNKKEKPQKDIAKEEIKSKK